MAIVHFRTQNEKKERKKEETNKGEEKKNEEPITPWCSLFLKNLSKKIPALYGIRILITRLEVPKTYPYSEVNESNQRHEV
jgi:RNA recognition motif-containing protein